jgi:hypothetical protein
MKRLAICWLGMAGGIIVLAWGPVAVLAAAALACAGAATLLALTLV